MLHARSGSCLYVHHGYVRRRLAFVELFILLASETLLAVISIDVVDNALMLRVYSTSKERLLYVLVDNCLSRGSWKLASTVGPPRAH